MNPLKEYLNSLKTPESREIESMKEQLMSGGKPFLMIWEITCSDDDAVAVKRALYNLVSTSKKRVKMPSGAHIIGRVYCNECENGTVVETPDITELRKVKRPEKVIYELYEATTKDGGKYLLYEGFHSDYDEIW